MVFILVLIYSILFSATSYSGTISPSTDDTKHIEFGSKFKYVLKIIGQYQNDDLFFGSAVAISPNYILTAAHIVDKSKGCFIDYNNKVYSVNKVIQHPNFKNNDFDCNDIAILILDNSLDLDIYPKLYNTNDEVGRICYMSGFGLTGDFNTGFHKDDGKRRAGSNIIDKIEKNMLICSPSLESDKTELEFLIAGGDSGGGLFINNKLAGINSCLFARDKKGDASYGDESGHTRISYHIEWIENTIKETQNAQKKK